MKKQEMGCILQRATEKYGFEAQMQMAIEEMSELMKELCKYFRYAENDKEIVEEIADVKIMIWQMEMLFNYKDKVNRIMEKKIRRLKKRMEKDEK